MAVFLENALEMSIEAIRSAQLHLNLIRKRRGKFETVLRKDNTDDLYIDFVSGKTIKAGSSGL